MPKAGTILFIIILSQFCCTSLWFAGNAIISNLASDFHLPDAALGHLTSAIQFGFISGTLCFAIFTISDRFSPSTVFFVCSLLAGICNLAVSLPFNNFTSLLFIRLSTGFFLAGIYPVGMKLAADHFEHGLGRSLGFLVGALVLGTSFPHFLKATGNQFPWRFIVYATSLLAFTGGFLVRLFVPDGPYRKALAGLDIKAFLRVFHHPKFRAAAFGYFGHMWELYAFWTFVPFALAFMNQHNVPGSLSIPFMSFFIIGIGGPACMAAGYLSAKWGERSVAMTALFCSGVCCLLSPIVLLYGDATIGKIFLVFWGIMVIADSPLYSTLVAKQTTPASRGTALTIVNCIGFAITIISIQLLNFLQVYISPVFLFLPLVPGPALGLIAMLKGKHTYDKNPTAG